MTGRIAAVATIVFASLFCLRFSVLANDHNLPSSLGGGSQHTLVALNDGTVWAWGWNAYGQLGDGTQTDRHSPVSIAGLTNIVAVTGGGINLSGWSQSSFSLGLRADGKVMAWGANDSGQLGIGTTVNSLTPVLVTNLTNIIAVSGGGYHTLALKSDGTVRAWGYGAYGQLGSGGTTNCLAPVTVANLTNIISVGAGLAHSVALRSDGRVFVWGHNIYNELGDGTTTEQNTPVLLAGVSNIVAIGVGGSYSAGLKADGTVWAWGGNLAGGNQNLAKPIALTGLSNVVEIAVGDGFANAIKNDGTEWEFTCQFTTPTPGFVGQWTYPNPTNIVSLGFPCADIKLTANGIMVADGLDNFGQIGNGSTSSSFPQFVVPVSNLWVGAKSHTVLCKADGTAYAWGANWFGQLGDGTTLMRSVPVQINQLLDVTGTGAGVSHSLAVTAEGSVWSWGANGYGQLGNGAATNVFNPATIAMPTNILAIAAGDHHSLALTTNQTVLAWGANLSGQVGDGTTSNRLSQVSITNLAGIAVIAAGSRHSIAVSTNGTVYSWGENICGQLGDGTTTNRLAPVTINGVSNVVSVAAGNCHTLALDTNGTVWAWGYNAFGQLGVGDITNRLVPVAITNISGAVSIACGGEFSAAVTTNGNLWMWGKNVNGQTGTGTGTNQLTPVLVIGTAAVTGVQAGEDHVVVAMADGTVRAWGGNLSGQLGTGIAGSQNSPVMLNGFNWLETPFTAAIPNALATNSVRYYRGSGSDPTYESFIIPLNFQRGIKLDDLGGNTNKFAGATPWFSRIQNDTRSHIGLTSTFTNSDGSLSNTYSWTTNFQNPIVTFGSSGGGSSLYVNQGYDFGVYAGAQYESTNSDGTNFLSPIRILVYRKVDFVPGQTNLISPVATNYFTIPRRTVAGDQTAWNQFASNGFTLTIQSNGLSTTLQLVEEPTWSPLTNFLSVLTTSSLTNTVPTNQLTWNQTTSTGIPGPVQTNAEETQIQIGVEPTTGAWGARQAFTNARNGPFILTHRALVPDYCYVVEAVGIYPSGTNAGYAVVTSGTTNLNWDRLYSVDFDTVPVWRSVFIDQPQFNGQPLPPDYLGQSVAELQSNLVASVTNIIALTNSIYTNLDNSPELRRHPTLDGFVQNMGNDPVALANYVQNTIELTDALTYNENTGQASAPSVNQDGVSRNALDVYLEGQGSPMEQCALLIYLLRQAGYPAAYVFPTNSNIQMLDTRLSTLLRMQLKGAVDQNGNLYTTNSLITVNYPWVVTQIGTNCVHLFPWLKDTEMLEGLNLYDYLPTNYNSGEKWFRNYIYGDSNILSLSLSGDTPATLFPSFVAASLAATGPGLALDDIGMKVINRQHYYSRWQDFPTPNVVTNQSQVVVVDSLTSSVITNVSPLMTATNLFNTVDVLIYNTANTNSRIDTLDMRMADLLNRKFLVFTNQNLLQLWLAPFIPGNTNQSSFGTSDPSLTNQQVLTLPLTNGNVFSITLTHKRHKAVSAAAAPVNSYLNVFEQLATAQTTKFVQTNDIMAICFHVGRVSSKMVDVQAQNFWQVEAKKNSNTNYVPTLPDFQGTAAYLMGMDYYNKVGRFTALDEQLHKVHVLSWYAEGLFKLTSITKSGTNLMQPSMDMYLNEVVHAGNGTDQAGSGADFTSGMDDFMTLLSAEIGAQEHNVLNGFYTSSNAVSSVMLLRLAQQKSATNVAGILELNRNNYATMGNTASLGYGATLLKNYDSGLWAVVTNQFSGWDADYVRVFITPAPMTNYSGYYKGMGAVIQGRSQAAFVASGNMNFGEGDGDVSFVSSSFNDPTALMTYYDPYSTSFDQGFSTTTFGNFDNYSAFAPLGYSWNRTAPGSTVLIQPAVNVNDPTVVNNVGVPTPTQTTSAMKAANEMYLSSQTIDSILSRQRSVGDLGGRSYLGQRLNTIRDPVSPVTGSLNIDIVDLAIGGPMPLQIRRNYSSQNLSDKNNFGFGWKVNYVPYLQVSTNITGTSTNIVLNAAETDGSVIAYRQQSGNTNLFIPLATDNPGLDNNSIAGIGSIVNLFNSTIVASQVGTNTFYALTGPDGNVRKFSVQDFPLVGRTNTISRLRPYLTTWQDNAGNSWTFSYGTNSTSFDYGQLNRIQSSNGSFVGFVYSDAGYITQAYSSDGREVDYTYDNFGDLVSVSLPDGAEIQYNYGRYLLTNNSVVYVDSNHLLEREAKPEGRQLQNFYDTSGRVIAQLATVGTDLNVYTNAQFAYSNNFVLTNAFTNLISGYTLIADVNSNVTRYDYTNGMITKVTDPLNQITTQNWYFTNDSSGGFKRSLKSLIDPRGLMTQFLYDTNGNVTNTMISGTDLTGAGPADGLTNAVYAFAYTNLNLLSRVVDPLGNSITLRYGNTNYPYLPTSMERYASNGVAIRTNLVIYTNTFSVVTNGTIVSTNSAFGLVWRSIRAFGSADVATNELVHDGRGFVTSQIAYTGTSDPNPTNAFYFDNRGQLVQVTDAAGRYTQFQYDAMGRPISRDVFDTNGSTPVFSENIYYNENGDVTWYDGPRFNPEDYVWRDYDGGGRETQEIHWRSRAKADGSGVEAETGDNLYATTFFTYDKFGNHTSVSDQLGNVMRLTHDAIGQTTGIRRYGMNNPTPLTLESFGYEPGGNISAHTNALGAVTQKFYTSAGLPKLQINSDGSTNAWRYDLSGRLVKTILQNGNFSQTTYDDANRTITQVFNNPTNALSTNIAQFNFRGNLIQATDPLGNVYTNLFDGLDRIKFATGPSIVAVTSTGISPFTNFVTNILQEVTGYVYDGSGKVLTVSNAVGETTVTTSDALGRPVLIGTYPSNSVTAVRLTSFYYSPDHHSVTVTNGSGTNAIASTFYTDTEGHNVLTVHAPTNGVTEFMLQKYDVTGHPIAQQQLSSSGGSLTTWATNGWTYDSLYRVQSVTSRDGATMTFAYDPLGNVLSRAMPGGLSWTATYLTDGRMSGEQMSGGGASSRSMTYQYYASNSPFAGLLQVATDGRGTSRTNSYDDFLRLATVSTGGSLPEQQTTSTFSYDLNNQMLTLSQSFNNSTTGPSTSVSRSYTPANHLGSETVSLTGGSTSVTAPLWNAAGRRSGLGIQHSASLTAIIPFSYQADGLMTAAGEASFGYANNGLLTTRTNNSRTYAVNQRDGTGRILQTTTTAAGGTALTENLTWRNDGRINTYTAGRGDFTDSRSFGYSALAARLTNEVFNLATNQVVTNNYAIDNGQSGGLGILTAQTASGAVSTAWTVPSTGGLDSLSRLAQSQNNLINRTAYGLAPGAGTVSATLDSKPLSVEFDGSVGNGNWRADFNTVTGSHTLSVSAIDPTGAYSGSTNSTFTVATNAMDTITNVFDGNGNITQRVWINSLGQTNRTQTLAWDAFDRLLRIADRDSQSNGFDWVAVYDGLGRRLQTAYTMVISNAEVAQPNNYSLLNSVYDPNVEFLEVGVYVNHFQFYVKTHGPDASGTYGGLQGMGGLETVTQPGLYGSTAVIQDFFGNILASAQTNAVTWNASRFSGYGPVPGYQSPALSLNVGFVQSLGWHGKRVDETGLIYLGARHYDPSAGRFLSFDPMWNAGDLGGFSAFGGDPVNFFDPDGRIQTPLSSSMTAAEVAANARTCMDCHSRWDVLMGGYMPYEQTWFSAHGDNGYVNAANFVQPRAGGVLKMAVGGTVIFGSGVLTGVSFGFSSSITGPALIAGSALFANGTRQAIKGDSVTIGQRMVENGADPDTVMAMQLLGDLAMFGSTAVPKPQNAALLESILIESRTGMNAAKAQVGNAQTIAQSRIGASFVFRGERSSANPAQVFKDGFQSKGNVMDLQKHASANSPNTGFIPTSQTQEIATGFAGKNGYTYIIRDNGTGLNVNKTLGIDSPFPEQLEVAFPHAISSEDIVGAISKKDGTFIPNPNYKGPQFKLGN